MSELRADTITASDGTSPVTLTKQSAAKMWGRVDQTSTQSITDSFNLSSISDGGTGKTTITMTNAMSNSTYAIVGSGQVISGNACIHNEDAGARSTTVFGIYHIRQDGGVSDTKSQTAVHGDLA
jgi:PPE-repeat protein